MTGSAVWKDAIAGAVGTYDAAPVPPPSISPSRIAISVESLDGMTIPMHNAEPTKNTISRHANDLYAGGKTLRGFSVSAATIDTYSGPVMLQVVSLLTKTLSR
jgi:hypothetical protein